MGCERPCAANAEAQLRRADKEPFGPGRKVWHAQRSTRDTPYIPGQSCLRRAMWAPAALKPGRVERSSLHCSPVKCAVKGAHGTAT
eukprot:350616-Chlamydomonas_euryale.AAC.1